MAALNHVMLPAAFRAAVVGFVVLSLAQANQSRPQAKRNHAKRAIHILEAKYGDTLGHTCSPNISLCEGRSLCEFIVGDGLCSVKADAKNLEVIWNCGEGTQKKGQAAAKGTKISLSCVGKTK